MQIFVPDASVILAFFLDEGAIGEKAAVFFSDVRTGKYQARVPSIWFYEVANTLGRLNLPKVKTFRDELFLYRDNLLVTVELSKKATSRAFALMEKYRGNSFYDASYHALALDCGGIFLTADQEYFYRVRLEKGIELV